MPLQKLEFRPGVNREGTTLANEGGWFECDKIRFRSGFPEKIGGWVLDTGVESPTVPIGTFVDDGTTNGVPATGSFWGVCRSMWNWITLTGQNLLGLGTNVKFYVQNGEQGIFYDITPIRGTPSVVASNAFTTTQGSTTVRVNNSGHGALTNDFVCISAVSAAVNGLAAAALQNEYQITYYSNNAYDITLRSCTTLSSAISASDTTITVVNSSSLASSGAVLIGTEKITYSGSTVGTSTTQLTGCTRGAYSSTAATHASGDGVTAIPTSTGTPAAGATFTYQINSGLDVSTTAYGWGAGGWGGFNVGGTSTGWGEAASTGGENQQLRLWSQSNYGADLVLNPRGGALYYWANNASPTKFDRAQLLGPSATIETQYGPTVVDAYCPSVANLVLVSDSSRFVIAFGCNNSADPDAPLQQNPLFIAWSDQENFAVWDPTDVTTQAGSYQLSRGSQIIAVQQTRQEILIWTDAAIYSMQYLGPPYVWGFQIMGDNISIAGPNVVSVANNVTYWMGTDKFYMYSGRVETLPCTLRQYVFQDINMGQSYQFFSGTNEGYNEIWWFYCSAQSDTVDKYVVFNHLERTWYYGTLARTYWLDSPLRNVPMSTGYDGKLIYQETGNDDGATVPGSLTPIEAYVQSSDFDIGDGHNFGIVWRIIPDVTFDGSNVANPSLDFTVRPRQNPGANYGSSDAPPVASTQTYSSIVRTQTVQQFTEYAYVRIRGRQMAFKVSSNDLGVAWQLGTPRIDVRPDGRR